MPHRWGLSPIFLRYILHHVFCCCFLSGSNSRHDRPEILFISIPGNAFLKIHQPKFGTVVTLIGSENGWLHEEPCFHFTLWGVCTVALNRPPTQNGDHINPPDIPADGNTNVYFWWGEKQTANKILFFFVKESGQALPWIGYFWSLVKSSDWVEDGYRSRGFQNCITCWRKCVVVSHSSCFIYLNVHYFPPQDNIH